MEREHETIRPLLCLVPLLPQIQFFPCQLHSSQPQAGNLPVRPFSSSLRETYLPGPYRRGPVSDLPLSSALQISRISYVPRKLLTSQNSCCPQFTSLLPCRSPADLGLKSSRAQSVLLSLCRNGTLLPLTSHHGLLGDRQRHRAGSAIHLSLVLPGRLSSVRPPPHPRPQSGLGGPREQDRVRALHRWHHKHCLSLHLRATPR